MKCRCNLHDFCRLGGAHQIKEIKRLIIKHFCFRHVLYLVCSRPNGVHKYGTATAVITSATNLNKKIMYTTQLNDASIPSKLSWSAAGSYLPHPHSPSNKFPQPTVDLPTLLFQPPPPPPPPLQINNPNWLADASHIFIFPRPIHSPLKSLLSLLLTCLQYNPYIRYLPSMYYLPLRSIPLSIISYSDS